MLKGGFNLINEYSEQIQIFISNALQLINIQLKTITNIPTIDIKNIYPLPCDYRMDSKNSKVDFPEEEFFDSLGRLYETTLPRNLRKDLGQFYTRDSSIIHQMISDSDLFQGAILEPSCGSGLFLVHIANRISDILIKNGKNPEEIIHYIQKNLYRPYHPHKMKVGIWLLLLPSYSLL